MKERLTRAASEPRRLPWLSLSATLLGVCASAFFLFARSGEKATEAIIVDSGSTNSAGFQIVVPRSGRSEFAALPRGQVLHQSNVRPAARLQRVPRDVVKRFYADLEAARPLSSLPALRCMKSASFGTVRKLEFEGESTADLTCGDGGDPRLQALIQDINEIVALFRAEGSQLRPR